MDINKETTSQERLNKVSQALEEARKLQQDWMNYGPDCVHLYVEDVDGDWLDKWREDEEDLEAVVSSHNSVFGSVVESVSAFLESDDSVAVKVRERLETRSPLEFAAELEKCLSIPEEDNRLFAIKNVLSGSVRSEGTNRNASNETDEIELLDLAESLLEKLTKIKFNFT